ncbi:hypothetical protein WCV54_28020, partial [Klebsiella pneumoniae]|uniref:hypothetical protein n=1 Tax=Klebsiella pneumoniae TaxID=573 RepID=UPI0030161823
NKKTSLSVADVKSGKYGMLHQGSDCTCIGHSERLRNVAGREKLISHAMAGDIAEATSSLV